MESFNALYIAIVALINVMVSALRSDIRQRMFEFALIWYTICEVLKKLLVL